MTLEEFRILHSTLIEHYQYIEAHLDAIYATLMGESFYQTLKDVEKDSLTGVLIELMRLQREKDVIIVSGREFSKIQKDVIHRRNFWVHSCYFDMIFSKNGAPKKQRDVDALYEDIEKAKRWRKILNEKKIGLMYE